MPSQQDFTTSLAAVQQAAHSSALSNAAGVNTLTQLESQQAQGNIADRTLQLQEALQANGQLPPILHQQEDTYSAEQVYNLLKEQQDFNNRNYNSIRNLLRAREQVHDSTQTIASAQEQLNKLLQTRLQESSTRVEQVKLERDELLKKVQRYQDGYAKAVAKQESLIKDLNVLSGRNQQFHKELSVKEAQYQLLNKQLEEKCVDMDKSQQNHRAEVQTLSAEKQHIQQLLVNEQEQTNALKQQVSELSAELKELKSSPVKKRRIAGPSGHEESGLNEITEEPLAFLPSCLTSMPSTSSQYMGFLSADDTSSPSLKPLPFSSPFSSPYSRSRVLSSVNVSPSRPSNNFSLNEHSSPPSNSVSMMLSSSFTSAFMTVPALNTSPARKPLSSRDLFRST